MSLRENKICLKDFVRDYSTSFESVKEWFYDMQELDADFYREQIEDWAVQAGIAFEAHSTHNGQALHKFYYDVGFGQGSGASFSCLFHPEPIETPEQLAKEEEIHTLRRDYPWVYAMVYNGYYYGNIDIDNGHYVHSNMMSYEDDLPEYSDSPSALPVYLEEGLFAGMSYKVAYENFMNQIEDFRTEFLELCRSKAKQIHSDMEDEVLSWHDDETVIRYFQETGMEYEGEPGNSECEEFVIQGNQVTVYKEVEELCLPTCA